MDPERSRNDAVEELFLDVFDLPAREQEARLAGAPTAVAAEVRKLLRFGPETLALVRSGDLQPAALWRADPDLIGRELGPYRLEALIGSGSFGAVYRGRRIDFDQTVAVKVLKSSTLDLVARFRRERQVLATIGDHANIVSLLDGRVEPDGTSYIAMEHVDGVSITQHCRERELHGRARIELFRDVCRAVQHAHASGVFHRDLKPDNIRVADDQAKLLDFGIAKILAESAVPGDGLVTGEHEALFTPIYASPEQLQHEPVRAASEVYSLGVILFELVTGELPYDLGAGATLADVRAAVCHAAPRRANQVAKRVDGDLARILDKALRKDPGDRYRSVQEFDDDLGRLLADEPVRATAPTLSYVLAKFARRHRLALAAATVVIGAVAFAWSSAQQALAKEREAGVALNTVRLMAEPVYFEELVEQARFDLVATIEAEPRLRAWQRETDAIASKRLEYLAFLEDLRQRAGRPSSSRRQEQHRIAVRRDQLAYLRMRLGEYRQQHERAQRAGASAEERKALAKLVAEALALVRAKERELLESTDWVFDDMVTQTAHDQVASIVRMIDAFEEQRAGRRTALRGRIQGRRIEAARRLLADEQQHRLWRRLQQRLDRDARFSGLAIAPQEALVPLGPDGRSGLEEFAFVHSGDVPVRDPATGRLGLTDASAIVFVLLPGGACALGGGEPPTRESAFAFPLSAPPHRHEVEPFLLAKHELTQAQWQRLFFLEQSILRPAKKSAEGPAISLIHPLDSVPWPAADASLRSVGLVLPTEQQWEYACRAGTETPWHTGAEAASLRGFANLQDGSAATGGGLLGLLQPGDGYPVHAPIGSFAANAFGLHDMHGNVAEWCGNHPRDYADGSTIGAASGLKVVRGGSWATTPDEARSSWRSARQPTAQFKDVGVRPARPLHR